MTSPADGRIQADMAFRDLAVIGASAGGLDPLRKLVGGLPPDHSGSVCVVLHTSPWGTSSLADILSKSGPLQATQVTEAEPVRPGRIYVAGPNRHLIVEPGIVRSLMGPKESLHRPSVDVL